jgi:putative heme-binding domain-containing protein
MAPCEQFQQIKQGQELYGTTCGRCHGDNGAAVPNVELFKQFRRATSDEEIAALIRQGIPGTGMPPHAFTNEQALNVVAFLRSMVGAPAGGSLPVISPNTDPIPALALRGDAARGRAIFTGKGGCASCHRAEGSGGTTGPDLSAAGATRVFGPFSFPPDPVALARSILDPNADISPGFEMYQVTPQQGAAVRGTLLNQDTFSVQMLDDAQHLRSFLKSEVREFGFLPSPMPPYRGRLTDQEVADVVSYLLTLGGSSR